MTTSSATIPWYNALTMKERIELLKDVAPASIGGGDGAELFERWKATRPFGIEDLFHQRLATDGLTEDDFLRILHTPAEALGDCLDSMPTWPEALERAFAVSGDLPLFDLAPSRGEESSPFLEIARPLLIAGYRQLQERIAQAGAGVPWETDRVSKTLFSHLTGRITMFLRRTLVLELQVANLEETLQGETPEARYQDFIGKIARKDVALEIFERYPVLTRQILQCIDQWIDFATEFVQRYAEDWPTLEETFARGELGELVEARPGAGDSHRDGRSVTLLTFSSGRKLVYKPRSLGGERSFNNLLRWVNQRGFEPAFRTLEILDQENYGWVEFIEPAACATEEEIQRFYQRQGGYLALLYLLDGRDIHFENVIAAGEHPVLVDLETLFQPPIDTHETSLPFLPAGNAFYRGVHQTGLLPQRIWGAGDREEGIDLSGLASSAGQLTAQQLLDLAAVGTDQMRFIRKAAEIPEMDHSPQLRGASIEVADYRDAITAGFTQLYRLLLAHRPALQSTDGPLAAFAAQEIRVIYRATFAYSLLLGESFHPDVLQDALERDLLFDQLWREVEGRPHLAGLIPAERQDLERADIPLFTSRPDSLDVWTGQGERLPNHLSETGMSRMETKLRNLDEADLARQVWLIETSLDALPRPGEKPRRTTYPFTEATVEATRDDLLAAALEAGERLETLAFRGLRGEASWSIVKPLGDRHWAYEPAEPGLYQGLAGIALFLAHLGGMVAEDRFTELARGAWKTLRYQLETGLLILPGVGAFAGWGGLLYAAVHLAELWGDPGLLDQAEAIVEELPEKIAQDDWHDLIGGAAGCLLSLLSLQQQRPSQRTVDAAVLCGERLLANAREMDTGCGWVLAAAGPTPLAGLGHGAAGIALALLKLADLTGQKRFHTLARKAIDYERTLFSPAAKNWVDLREGERPEDALHKAGEDFVVGWCHGAPGIGLGRLAGLPYLDDSRVQEEIDIALQTTIEQGFGSNHCLCHGDLGNLDLLLVASETLNDSELRARTYRLAQGTLQGIRDQGWRYGYPARVEPLGLMVGLAGIGYQLLRLAEPSRVPSVLILDPPGARTDPRPTGGPQCATRN